MKNIAIDDKIHKIIKLMALENNKTISQFVSELIINDKKVREYEDSSRKFKTANSEFEFQGSSHE